MTLPAASTTTQEQDRHTASQRRVNIIWEATQATIALAVVASVLFVNAKISLAVNDLTAGQSSALMQLNVTGALVIGFYFGRTNHERQGGVDKERR